MRQLASSYHAKRPFHPLLRNLEYQEKHPPASSMNVYPDYDKKPSNWWARWFLNRFDPRRIMTNNVNFKQENAAGNTAYPTQSFSKRRFPFFQFSNFPGTNFEAIDKKENKYLNYLDDDDLKNNLRPRLLRSDRIVYNNKEELRDMEDKDSRIFMESQGNAGNLNHPFWKALFKNYPQRN